MTLLEVSGLSVRFRTHEGDVPAVTDVSLAIDPGEIVGMVGESGSGKSASALSIMRLLPREARVEGVISFAGSDLGALSTKELNAVRGRDIGMIFQEPMTALDPVFTVGHQIEETLRRHLPISRREARTRSVELLEQVGITEPALRHRQHPHELSGGMRQRAMIAIAISCGPRLLIADEPTTAVDVTVQAQILDLLRHLCTENDMALLFITHDLGVVAELCQRVITMYAGQVIECGTVQETLRSPLHPYTSALLQAVPRRSLRGGGLRSIPGRVPQISDEFVGCRFASRCEAVTAACAAAPELVGTDDGRRVRCVRHEALSLPGAR